MNDCVPCDKSSAFIEGNCHLCGNARQDGEDVITQLTIHMTEGTVGEESRADKLRPILWVMNRNGSSMVHTSCLQVLFSQMPMQKIHRSNLND